MQELPIDPHVTRYFFTSSNTTNTTSTDIQMFYTGRHRANKQLCNGVYGGHLGQFVTISGTEYCENCGQQVSQQWQPPVWPTPIYGPNCTCWTSGSWCPVHGYTQPYPQPTIWCGALQAS